jgi:hypothetical protein
MKSSFPADCASIKKQKNVGSTHGFHHEVKIKLVQEYLPEFYPQ